ncbi:MAG: response regulator [Rhodobacteraceae bacterium]|nr:response regulator [Paracoccaceae bacterium]
MNGPKRALPHRLIPTSDLPLLGLTLLLVEDSRVASEALRQMCLHSGARLRRADCIRSARRHLAAYFPSVSIIDMGLPDGDGADLISDLRARGGDLSPVIALSGAPETEAAARRAGAQAFLHKPLAGLGVFQQTILKLLPPAARPRGLRALSSATLAHDDMALRDDLGHAARLMRGPLTPETRRYVADFLVGVSRCAQDAALTRAAEAAAMTAADPNTAPMDDLRSLVDDRLRTGRAAFV